MSEEVTADKNLEQVGGRASFSMYGTTEHKVWLHIFEARDGWVIDDIEASILRTTLHEIGHGFGLNHVNTNSYLEKMKPWYDTLMWPFHVYDTPIVDEQTLLAFKCLYPTNGWGGNSFNLCNGFEMFFPWETL